MMLPVPTSSETDKWKTDEATRQIRARTVIAEWAGGRANEPEEGEWEIIAWSNDHPWGLLLPRLCSVQCPAYLFI